MLLGLLIFLSIITIVNLVGLVLLSREVTSLGEVTAEFSTAVTDVIVGIKRKLDERF